MSRRVAVVMSGFPRVSETFALGELTALADSGRLAGIFATKPGDLSALQPEARSLLPHLRVLESTTPGAQADEVARYLVGTGVRGIHGYFAHAPAAVAEGAARSLGIPYSFGAHALDARKVEGDVLRRRAAGAACVLACNDDTADVLRDAGADVNLLPHGVDLDRFTPTPVRVGAPTRLLAVGRLVEKKGFDVLVEALALADGPYEVRLVGDGPERPALEDAIRRHDLDERVTLVGRRTHEELPADYVWADVVAVPSVVDAAGDRDGLPNVLLEAFASGRAVVASDAGAISSAVRDGDNALLVAPRSPAALATALDRLARDPVLRERLGRAARRLVVERYDRVRQTERFVDALEHAYA